jgi:hypothetical protein
MTANLLPKDWQVGDELILAYEVMTIESVGKKSWGCIPMSVRSKAFNTKVDPRCLGIEGVHTLGPSGYGITPDCDRGPEQYRAHRVFRNGVEIWRDVAQIEKWPESFDLTPLAREIPA